MVLRSEGGGGGGGGGKTEIPHQFFFSNPGAEIGGGSTR